ncbi:MAG: GntR family transcriptional regulator [Chitinivibrionales bacterium]|nr:GntR family transcriptional regulator [Chitinivibrionales bacterium]
MRQVSKQLKRALRHLEAAAEGLPRGAALPPVRDLARGAGVAYNTMWKALALCRELGLVETKPGSPARLTGDVLKLTGRIAPPPAGTGPASKALHERAAERIYGDIVSGAYSPAGSLPPTKELAARLGVCCKTLHAALRLLESSGVVREHRRRYYVSPPRGVRGTRVCLLAAGREDGEAFVVTPRTHSHLRCLEQECARNGLNLTVCPMTHRDGALQPVRGRIPSVSRRDPSPLLGYMVWTVGLPTVGLTPLLSRLCLSGLPVAILGEAGEYEFAGSRRLASAAVSYHMCERAVDGERVGHYLLAQGHRKVAFVTPLGGLAYERRLAGLRSAYEVAGLHNSVFECGPGTIAEGGRVEQDFRSVQTRVNSLLAEEAKRAAPHDPPLHRALEALRQQTHLSVLAQMYRHGAAPYVEEALSHPGVTAVVGANDWVAMECLDVLKQRGVRVPQEMAVVGFDDCQEAFVLGLTSYNFNGEGAIRAMLHHLLYPSDLRARKQPDIQGFITVRASG